MEKEKLNELKDAAWNAKNQGEWDAVMLTIKEAVEQDCGAATYLRKYCKSILPKKKEWWSKSSNRPVINKPPVLRNDVQDAMLRAFNAVAAYYERKL